MTTADAAAQLAVLLIEMQEPGLLAAHNAALVELRFSQQVLRYLGSPWQLLVHLMVLTVAVTVAGLVDVAVVVQVVVSVQVLGPSAKLLLWMVGHLPSQGRCTEEVVVVVLLPHCRSQPVQTTVATVEVAAPLERANLRQLCRKVVPLSRARL